MINKITLLGRIGNKFQKDLTNGSKLITLSIATSKKYIDSTGVKKEETTWHNVNLYNKIGEIANKYANVGDLVYIEGEVRHRKVQSGNGEEKYLYSVTASEIKLLPNAKRDMAEANGNIAPDAPKIPESELPF